MPPFLPTIKWNKLEGNFKSLEFQDDLYFARVYQSIVIITQIISAMKLVQRICSGKFSGRLIRRGFIMMVRIYLSLKDVIFPRLVVVRQRISIS